MILAVSYRAELLEKEMKEQETRVSISVTMLCVCVHWATPPLSGCMIVLVVHIANVD